MLILRDSLRSNALSHITSCKYVYACEPRRKASSPKTDVQSLLLGEENVKLGLYDLEFQADKGSVDLVK
jgi:hypothetical protein